MNDPGLSSINQVCMYQSFSPTVYLVCIAFLSPLLHNLFPHVVLSTTLSPSPMLCAFVVLV